MYDILIGAIILVIIIIICMCKKSSISPVLKIDQSVINNIPRKIYMTTHIDIQFVPDLLKCHANKLDLELYDDVMARKYLVLHWNQEVVEYFDNLKMGAHKMDLWRYCKLYMDGGIYLDIKTIPVKNLEEIFEIETNTNTWYTCLSAVSGCYQGIIATPPKNPILLRCIHQMLKTSQEIIDDNYLIFTEQMHNICKIAYNSLCDTSSLYISKDATRVPNLILFKESCDEVECMFTIVDRYGICCNIRNTKGEHIFRTRESEYPWKKLPENQTSIKNRKSLKIIKSIGKPPTPLVNLPPYPSFQ